MSSGFISEADIAAQKQKRQEEWEKVRQPDEPVELQEEPYDCRSLFEKLKEQKDKKDYEYEEAHKLKNLIRGLDDDEVDFLHVIDKAKAQADHKHHMEESAELRDFREQVATIREQSLDNKIQSEAAKPKIVASNKRPSQKSILSGVVRKRSAIVAGTSSSSSASASSSSSSTPITPPTPTATTTKSTKANEASQSESSNKVPQQTAANTSSTTKTKKPVGGLRCIGLLPGLAATYDDSSDSDKSTDTDEDFDYSSYDWLGRSIMKQQGGGCDDQNCSDRHKHS